MSAFLRAVVLPLSVLGLAACTGMQQKSDSAFVAPQRARIMGADQAYVQAVEQVARRRGIEVVWVNLPQKPKD